MIALLFIITVLTLPTAAAERERPVLYVGGVPFGVRFFTDGVLVVGYCDVECNGKACNPAREAGLQPGDCICRVDQTTVTTAAGLAEIVAVRP